MTKIHMTCVAAVAALVPVFAQADSHADRTGWPESFTVATASQGGTYFAYGSGWANLVAEELGLSGGGEVTGGPGQNMAL
ncbi:MAG: C4-dicarboxylate ABC transporter substrate-binding protein, partial [Pseudomonadota bacterium]